MFVLVSPIQKYNWEDTGRRVALPAHCTGTCVPVRAADRIALGVGEDEHVTREGKVYRYVPDGPPTGVRLSMVHASSSCIKIRRADRAANAELVELQPEDLQHPLFRHLRCCRHCMEQIGKSLRRSPEREVSVAVESR